MTETPGNIQIFKPHILEAVPYKGGSTREETNGEVYKLSSNENMLGPSPKAIEAIKQNLHTLHEYRFENDLAFRHILEKHFDQQLLVDQFIIANSGLELLDMIARGFCEEGTECILSSPTFMAYKNFSNLSGAKVIDVPLKADDFSLDVDGVLFAINEKTRILFISNPNNPTGALIPKTTMDALIEQLPSHVVLVYDEVYYHYVESSDFPRALDYILQGKNVIGLHSFSKAYGLAGIRLAYAFSTHRIAEYLQRIRRPFMVSTLTTVAGMAALGDKDHIKTTRELVLKEKQWLYGELDKLKVQYRKSQANFILIKTLIPDADLLKQMLHYGVMLRSTEVMKAKDCVRVTIGTREANEAFINGLKKIVQ